MKLVKSLLLGSAAAFAVVAGAQAADLPSKKAAPASYVKICDAYGAGFFYIPGTDTCLRVGGYLRFEVQYTPAKALYNPVAGLAVNNWQSQFAVNQDTVGHEYRGRVDLDARTATPWGTARTFIALRGGGTTGLRGAAYNYNAATVVPNLDAGKNQTLTMERAFVQFAGFTVGLATSNYAMMPSSQYSGNPWAGFPNGQRQIAYTATFGGGFSATVAIEDKQMWGYDQTYITKADTGFNLVGNLRLDQSWGFAAIHGLATNNSYASNGLAAGGLQNIFSRNVDMANNLLSGGLKKGAYAIGTTVKFNLPQLAAGDAIWLTANYTNGYLGALLSSGSVQNLSSASGGRVLGGVARQDADLVFDGVSVQNSKGWNVAGQLTHYWAPTWRSNFTAGYINISTPTQLTGAQAWGTGKTWEILGSLIWSPAKDFDIGLEVQYLNTKSAVQNLPAGVVGANGITGWVAAGMPGLNNSNVTTKLRVERTF